MRIPEVYLKEKKDPALLDFMDYTMNILNQGRYQLRVVSGVPAWTGEDGDMVMYASGTSRGIYFYINGQWNKSEFAASSGQTLINLGAGNNLIGGNDTDGFWVGNAAFASAPFRVSLVGALTATSATITGAITASSGTIGGFTINSSSLTAGTGATSVGLLPTSYPFFAGHGTPASAPFYVTNAGVIQATSGTIGGWTLASDKLTGGSDANYIALIPGTGIQMGNETFGSAPFSVTKAGVLVAKSGTVGGWTLADSTLTGSGVTYLTIDSTNSRIRTSDYASGALGSGWHIGTDIVEFNNIRARGKISTSVFEKDTISSVGGNFLVMDSDILNADMTALGTTLTIVGDTTFAVNDILRIKDGVDDEWLLVTNIASAPSYTVTRDQASAYAGDNPLWKKGTAVVNYGTSGEGGVFMTSSEGNSPYIHFFTHAGAPWTTTIPKTRIGNLAGIAGCSGYGIWGGDGYLGALEIIDILSISGSSGELRSNTTGNYPYLSFSNAGLQLKDSDTGGTYGTAKYGTDKYGYGAAVWIMNSTLKIPWLELKEPVAGASDVASMRLYNRSDNPGGVAEVGDLAVVNGKLKICTGAGTPGTWQVVGAQTA